MRHSTTPTITSTQPSHEACSQSLKAAIKRYNAIVSDKDSEWIKIKSQAIPRSSRIHLYKQKGDSPEAVYKVVLECLTRSDRQWSLGGWHSLFANVDARRLWDRMADGVQTMEQSSTPRIFVTRRASNDKTEASNVGNGGVVCVERTSRRKNHIRHIVTSITSQKSTELLPGCPRLAAYDIRMSPDDDPGLDSRVTLYYQANVHKSALSARQMNVVLEPYIITLITGPLSVLYLHGSPPYIVRRESTSYDMTGTSYNPDERCWSLQYRIHTTTNTQKPPIAQPSTAVNIQKSKYGYMSTKPTNHWRSVSWEPKKTSLQLASSLRQKRSFVSSPILIKSSYPSAAVRPHSPKLSPKLYSSYQHQHRQGSDVIDDTTGAASIMRSDIFSSSYTFGTHVRDGSMEDNVPDIVIEVDHATWSSGFPIDLDLDATMRSNDGSFMRPIKQKMIDQFAQFCVRYYRQRRQDGTHRYFVTLHHPAQLFQYITDELQQDVDALEGTGYEIEVEIKLQPQQHQQQNRNGDELLVNGNEWSSKPWESRSWLTNGATTCPTSKQNDGSIDVLNTDSELENFDSEFEDSDSESSESSIQSDMENGIFTNEMEDVDTLDHLVIMTATTTTTTTTDDQDSTIPPIDLEPRSSDAIPSVESIKEEVADIPMQKDDDEELPPLDIELDIPATDPPQLLKMHHYFDSLLQRMGWHILQAPEQDNLFVTIKKIDVSGHPTGAFLSESIWKDCSVWDIKAVVCSVGARKIWDSTLEDGIFVSQVSPTCSIWHHKTKGFWPVSPRDYVAFAGYYGTPTRVDICATSCTSESYRHITLPKDQPGYVRARLDLWAWRFERLDSNTTSVKLINQANLQGWIPSYVPNSFSGHNPDTIMHAHQYFNKHGAPPDLIMLQNGSLVDISYDHGRSSWRCEYIRSTEATLAMLTPEDAQAKSTKAEIRLDGRRRSDTKSYNVVIDPPPTRVRATTRAYDPYGWWLEIEHDEEHIIPQRGKILALIKPDSSLHEQQSELEGLVINGVPMPLQKDTTIRFSLQDRPIVQQHDAPKEGHLQHQRQHQHQHQQTPEQQEPEQQQLQLPQHPDSLESIVESLPISPVEHTQHTLAFLERMADQQFGWTKVSDKNKMQISKRQGSKYPNAVVEPGSEEISIPEQITILKASKVIEGFSVEEIAAIVTDIGKLREKYDDSIEEIEPLLPLKHGCTLVRQVVKGGFFIKSKEVYASVCTAVEKVNSTTNPTAKRVLHIETSIPGFPVPKNSKRQQVLFYISGWILEAIDPYTTTNNYPIPSTRVTFVSTLDLGSAVPAFFSNQITLGLHKKIRALENYLVKYGSPPYLIQPLTVEGFSGGKLDERAVKELYPELGTTEWTSVVNSFDQTVNSFKSTGVFRLLVPKRSSASLAPTNVSNLSAVLKSKHHPPQPMSSSPTFSATGFKRMQSLAGDAKETTSIQTSSCTSDTLSHGSGGANGNGEAGSHLLLFHTIIDLRSYPNGYEISTRLTRRGDEKKKDLSASLLCHVSELAPEPSQLITGSKALQRHAVELMIPSASRLSREWEYVLEMGLTRVQEESLNKRGTRLTVSGVLGEEDHQWRGLLLLNGREMEIGVTTGCALVTLQEESPLLDEENDQDDSAEEDEAGLSSMATTNMGGGVVAAAIGGVSAGVNDIRARMLMPFRSASNTFLLSSTKNDDDNDDASLFSSPFSTSASLSEDEQQQHPQKQKQKQKQQQKAIESQSLAPTSASLDSQKARHRSATDVQQQYRLRNKRATTTGESLVLCLILLLVSLFLIGLMIPAPLPGDNYIHERHLWSMPWVCGWKIQLRAVQG